MEQENNSNILSQPTLEELEKKIKEEDKKRKSFDKEYNQLLAERDKLKRQKSIKGWIDRLLGLCGLCRKAELANLQSKLSKLEEERKNEKTHHASELKRLRMNMASIEQQREGLKDIAANWKEIQARWESYEEWVGAEKLAELVKSKRKAK